LAAGAIRTGEFNQNQRPLNVPEGKIPFLGYPQISLIGFGQLLLESEVRERDGESHFFGFCPGEMTKENEDRQNNPEELGQESLFDHLFSFHGKHNSNISKVEQESNNFTNLSSWCKMNVTKEKRDKGSMQIGHCKVSISKWT
jgi:hypothetical protein